MIGHNTAINEQSKVLEVLTKAVLIVLVVGVLPNINSLQKRKPIAQGIIAIWQGLNLQLFGSIHDHAPNPKNSRAFSSVALS